VLWPDASRPLSSVLAPAFADDLGTGAKTIPAFIKARVTQLAEDKLPVGVQFPLANAATDSARALAGLSGSVAIRWLDPLGFDESPTAPRFGANNDYIAFFGDGWDQTPGNAPQWNGSGASGWLWVNHEYISNAYPTTTTAPTGQQLTLATFLRAQGTLTNDIHANTWTEADVNTHVAHAKQQVGGSWLHIRPRSPPTPQRSASLGPPWAPRCRTSRTMASGASRRTTTCGARSSRRRPRSA
jgi:hypothetical protein